MDKNVGYYRCCVLLLLAYTLLAREIRICVDLLRAVFAAGIGSDMVYAEVYVYVQRIKKQLDSLVNTKAQKVR